jgi:hypothetical protein
MLPLGHTATFIAHPAAGVFFVFQEVNSESQIDATACGL